MQPLHAAPDLAPGSTIRLSPPEGLPPRPVAPFEPLDAGAVLRSCPTCGAPMDDRTSTSACPCGSLVSCSHHD